MITLPPGRAVVAALYLACVLAATLGSGKTILGLGVPSGVLGAGHVPLFAGLCLVLLWAVQGPTAPRIWVVAVFCVLFAGADEWAQRFAADRVPEMRDFAANLAGVGIGLVVGIGFIKGSGTPPPISRGGPAR